MTPEEIEKESNYPEYICVRKYACGLKPACTGDCPSLYGVPEGMTLTTRQKERAGCKPCFYKHPESRVLTYELSAKLERTLIHVEEEAAICFNPKQTLHERVMSGGRG